MVRFKNRYLVFQLIPSTPSGTLDPTLRQGTLVAAIRTAITNDYGIFGEALIIPSITLKSYNASTGLGLLRVPRDHVAKVRLALLSLSSVSGAPTTLRVLHTAGTVHRAVAAATKQTRAAINLAVATTN